MYIHIGEDASVRMRDIVAILDTHSDHSSEFIEELLKRQEDKLINLAKKSFKSIVITTDHVYLSPFASGTLKKRSNFMNIQDF